MKLEVIVQSKAEVDMATAQDWYEKEQIGLGSDFLSEVHATIGRIKENPQIYPIIYRKIRRVFLHRFPYALYYLEKNETVVVIACIYARRDPAYIHTRLQKS